LVVERLPILHRRTAAHPEVLAEPTLQGVGLAGDGCQQLTGLIRSHALARSQLRSRWRLAFLLLAGLGLLIPLILALLAVLRLVLLTLLALPILGLILLVLLLIRILWILLALTILLLIRILLILLLIRILLHLP